jgi:hypothetical protein
MARTSGLKKNLARDKCMKKNESTRVKKTKHSASIEEMQQSI